MQPFFLESAVGQRFCVHYPVFGGATRGLVLYVHPFAEEMNKSRRMAALQAQAFCKAGYEVLQIDLFGCGDSSGDFGDATWQHWIEDIRLGYDWLRLRSNLPITLWGLRAGCLLAVEAAKALPEKVNFLFWQPTFSGKQYFTQFIRLKVAGEIASGQGKGVAEALRQQLSAGEPIEIAGYGVAPALALNLESAEMRPDALEAGNIVLLELTMRDQAELSPIAQRRMDDWHSQGWRVDGQVVQGPAFWQTAEIEDAPALLNASLAGLESWQ